MYVCCAARKKGAHEDDTDVPADIEAYEEELDAEAQVWKSVGVWGSGMRGAKVWQGSSWKALIIERRFAE